MENKPIIWITGQAGAGKTTLAHALRKNFERDGVYSFVIDGDDIRALFSNQNYTKEGRCENIRTAQKIAQYLQARGEQVIVSLVSPYIEIREELKAKTSVLEVYVHTTEIRGREHFFAKDYEKPVNEFLSLDTGKETVNECTQKILTIYRTLATIS